MNVNVDNGRAHRQAASLLAVGRMQRGGEERVAVSGCTVECRGLRQGSGGLERAGEPVRLCALGRRPVWADVNDGDTCVFTQEDDGTVYLEAVVAGSRARVESLPLGRVESAVRECASVGDYVVMRCADGSLSYLRRRSGGAYDYLGKLPSLPGFSVEAVPGVGVNVKSESVKFARPLTDLSGTPDADVAGRVDRAWREAYSQLVAEIHSRGQWLEPVRVRLALRLWDGTLLDVSEPVTVSPPQWSCRERVNVGLLYDAGKEQFTGADAMTLAGHGYTLRVAVEQGLPAAWAGVVAGIEVWVGEEPCALDGQEAPSMAFMHNASGNYLTFMPPLLSAGQAGALASAAPLGRMALMEAGTQAAVRRLPGAEYDSAIEGFGEPMPGATGGADCILGHGGFLHVGSGNDLYTSRRGNPFVLRCVTRGAGRRVRSMRAQLRGGGAFTRQYIYLSTDAGIVALCHKADGEHTNMRPVSAERLGEDEVWCATPQGVYALTGTGTLLCLRDAGAPVVLSGLERVRGLMWGNACGELWLCTASGALVLRQGDAQGYVRTGSRLAVAGTPVPALAWSRDTAGVVALFSLDSEEDYCPTAIFETDVELPGRAWLRQLRVEMTCGAGGVDFDISAPGFLSLAHGHAASLPDGELVLPLCLPHLGGSTVGGVRRMRLRLAGDLLAVRSVTVVDLGR